VPLTSDDIRGVCAVIAEEREAASPAGAPADNLAQAADDPARAAAIAREFVEAGAAWWAASRAMDQAFDGVEYPKDVVAFLPVEADAQSREVQAEIARQIRLLQAAESAPDLAAAISRLRP